MAKQTALVLGQDGTTWEVEYDDKNSLATMQAAVGGYIESVSYLFKGMDAYANEEGLYTPGLEPNPFAAVNGAAHNMRVMGNIIIPKITDNKRKRLEDIIASAQA